MKTIIISGSSRKTGNTSIVTNELSKLLLCEVIYLSDYKIGHFDYDYKNQEDDFLKLITELIVDYDTFIFATPVYWYSMTGVMKVFFDRLSDLITIKKDLGRKLRDKNMAVITSSTGANLNEQFWLPFKATAQYLGINYLGNVHTIAQNNNVDAIENFIEFLK